MKVNNYQILNSGGASRFDRSDFSIAWRSSSSGTRSDSFFSHKLLICLSAIWASSRETCLASLLTCSAVWAPCNFVCCLVSSI